MTKEMYKEAKQLIIFISIGLFLFCYAGYLVVTVGGGMVRFKEEYSKKFWKLEKELESKAEFNELKEAFENRPMWFRQ